MSKVYTVAKTATLHRMICSSICNGMFSDIELFEHKGLKDPISTCSPFVTTHGLQLGWAVMAWLRTAIYTYTRHVLSQEPSNALMCELSQHRINLWYVLDHTEWRWRCKVSSI